MRILIIARGFPTSREPQDGIFEFEQAKALHRAGHEVYIMTVDTRIKKQIRKIGITSRIIDNIPIYQIYYFPTSIVRRINYKWSSRLEQIFALKLYSYLQAKVGNFDIVHAHYLPCMHQGIILKEKYGIKLVGTEHWSEINRTHLKPYVAYLGNRTYCKVDALITVCQPLKLKIKELFSVDSFVVHNMIDDKFSMSEFVTKKEKVPFVFLMVGSVIYMKGIDVLLEAFYKSNLHQKNVLVKVVGSLSPYKSVLDKRIKELSLEDKFIIMGPTGKSEILHLLQNTDVFVLPSRSENFSVAVLEALAVGVPVISTLVGGIKECIDNDNGYLVPPENIDSLSKSLSYMYTNIEKFNRKGIREKCINKFSSVQISSQILDVYTKLK